MKISRRAAERLHAGHVWVYLSDVEADSAAQPGDVVPVEDQKGRFLGTALYSSTSQIALRLISRERVSFDRDLIFQRIQHALNFRRRIVNDSEAYRLVYSEADQLPGLIVDRYGDFLVVQLLTQGMDRFREEILGSLDALIQPQGTVLRNDAAVRGKESLSREVEVLGDVPEQIEIGMNGKRWIADLRHGQKTGLFLDQRQNYAAVAAYASGRALDCFTSTGGFALHLADKCEHVEAVDASEPSLARAAANAKLNSVENVSFRNANVFDVLASHAAQRHRFNCIVLDPPAFAKSKSSIDKALAGYKEINLKALRLLDSGGILATCSCSHHVSEGDFLTMLASAALDAGKTLRILERRVQSQDHPVLLSVPETLYLKCIIAEVS